MNRRAEDDLNNLCSDRSDDSSFINIILPAVYGREGLLTQNANLKPIQDRIKRSEQYVAIRGMKIIFLSNRYIKCIVLFYFSNHFDFEF